MKKFLLTTLVLTMALLSNAGQSFAQCGCGCGVSSATPCPEYAWAFPSNYQKMPCASNHSIPYSIGYASPCATGCAAPCATSYSYVAPCAAPCSTPCVTGCAAPCPCDPCDPCKCEKKRSWFYDLFHRNKDCNCKPKCNTCN